MILICICTYWQQEMHIWCRLSLIPCHRNNRRQIRLRLPGLGEVRGRDAQRRALPPGLSRWRGRSPSRVHGPGPLHSSASSARSPDKKEKVDWSEPSQTQQERLQLLLRRETFGSQISLPEQGEGVHENDRRVVEQALPWRQSGELSVGDVQTQFNPNFEIWCRFTRTMAWRIRKGTRRNWKSIRRGWRWGRPYLFELHKFKTAFLIHFEI